MKNNNIDLIGVSGYILVKKQQKYLFCQIFLTTKLIMKYVQYYDQAHFTCILVELWT